MLTWHIGTVILILGHHMIVTLNRNFQGNCNIVDFDFIMNIN